MKNEAHEQIQELHRMVDEFELTPEGFTLDLQLDLARLILTQMKLQGMPQCQLAEKAGLKEAYLSRVIHSEQNCTLNTIGRIFHALGTKASLSLQIDCVANHKTKELNDGQEKDSFAGCYEEISIEEVSNWRRGTKEVSVQESCVDYCVSQA